MKQPRDKKGHFLPIFCPKCSNPMWIEGETYICVDKKSRKEIIKKSCGHTMPVSEYIKPIVVEKVEPVKKSHEKISDIIDRIRNFDENAPILAPEPKKPKVVRIAFKKVSKKLSDGSTTQIKTKENSQEIDRGKVLEQKEKMLLELENRLLRKQIQLQEMEQCLINREQAIKESERPQAAVKKDKKLKIRPSYNNDDSMELEDPIDLNVSVEQEAPVDEQEASVDLSPPPVEPIVSKPQEPVITRTLEGRYFYADGTKKYYCIKCGGGPHKKDDETTCQYVSGGQYIICNSCMDKYYKTKPKERALGYKDREYDPKPIHIGKYAQMI